MRADVAKELSNCIKMSLKALGVAWEASAYIDPISDRRWTAPPLICFGSLFGLNNRDLMQVSISLPFEDFVEVYEDYLLHCDSGLSEQVVASRLKFGLTDLQATRLFPDTDRTQLYNFVPALAALAWYNYDGVVSKFDYQSLVVDVGVYKFGVHNSEAMTNTEAVLHTKIKGAYTKPHLNFGRRRDLPKSDLSRRFSAILDTLVDAPEQELHDLILGMTLLIANDCEAVRDMWMCGNKGNLSYPKATAEALETASEFRNYIDPVLYLFEQLVPFVLSSDRFIKLFGNNRRMSEERLLELDQALVQLNLQLKKEREDLCYSE